MHCLVTGGAGFIGSHLARRLRTLYPNRVRVLDNFTRAHPSQSHRDGPDAIRGDIRNPSELRSAMTGCEVVFHLAAKATVMDCERDPDDAFSVNLRGTYDVLRTAHELGVRRVVVASSREVYGEPSNARSRVVPASTEKRLWHEQGGRRNVLLMVRRGGN